MKGICLGTPISTFNAGLFVEVEGVFDIQRQHHNSQSISDHHGYPIDIAVDSSKGHYHFQQ